MNKLCPLIYTKRVAKVYRESIAGRAGDKGRGFTPRSRSGLAPNKWQQQHCHHSANSYAHVAGRILIDTITLFYFQS